MTQNEILRANLLDIVFENRNKNYGAYALRKFYPGRLTKSLSVSLGLVLLAFLLTLFSKKDQTQKDYSSKYSEVIVTDIHPPKPLEPQKPKPIEQPRTATAAFMSRIIMSDHTDLATDKELENAQIGKEKVEGKTPGEIIPTEHTTIATDAKPAVEKTDPPGITREAAYPGGKEMFAEFLKSRLNSPDDLEPGQKIKVLVRFKVDVDGSVSQIEVLESGGVRFDNEVMRVLKKMPKWSPALQNGITVSSYFIQVVTFVGQEQ